MAILCTVYLVCYTPFYVFILLRIRGIDISNADCQDLNRVVTTLTYLNTVLNPILYTFLTEPFKRQARNYFKDSSCGWLKRKKKYEKRRTTKTQDKSAGTLTTNLVNEGNKILENDNDKPDLFEDRPTGNLTETLSAPCLTEFS